MKFIEGFDRVTYVNTGVEICKKIISECRCNKMNLYYVFFEPMGHGGKFPENSTILDCARKLEIGLSSVCGGNGSCGKCLIKVLDGKVSPLTDEEKNIINPENTHHGYRLACKTLIAGDCKIFVPNTSISTIQRAQIESTEVPVQPEPCVKSYHVNLDPPCLNDLVPDLERVQMVLREQHNIVTFCHNLEVLRGVSQTLRVNDWKGNVIVRENEILALFPPEAHPLGVAIDLGTTKIAIYLMDLLNGNVLGSKGIMNPQVSFGGDIISRMSFATRSSENARQLQKMVVEAINKAVKELCQNNGLETGFVIEYVIAGNTAMHHLFLKLPVRQLCSSPFVPVVKSAIDIRARDLGLKGSPGAYIHFLPNIAGFVGADHVAMLLATEMHRREGIILALDIGTNTEICLSNDHRLASLSCASGPAFEGAHIKYGMRASDGAIEHFRLSENGNEYQIIGHRVPTGICGSGIIDIVAQLLLAGILDEGGRMHPKPGVRENNGVLEFIVASGNNDHPDITFTQQDVREIQLAKGAIRTGIEVLLKENNLQKEDIDQVIIAGAFGSYIDVQSAITIGMLPDLPLRRFQQAGNAAGMGAKIALINRQKRLEAQEIARRVNYIELASHPDFNGIFSRSLSFR